MQALHKKYKAIFIHFRVYKIKGQAPTASNAYLAKRLSLDGFSLKLCSNIKP